MCYVPKDILPKHPLCAHVEFPRSCVCFAVSAFQISGIFGLVGFLVASFPGCSRLRHSFSSAFVSALKFLITIMPRTLRKHITFVNFFVYMKDEIRSIFSNLKPISVTRGPFLESPETFRARKAVAKSRTLRLQNCFIHAFLI